jgi:hypothetical protein
MKVRARAPSKGHLTMLGRAHLVDGGRNAAMPTDKRLTESHPFRYLWDTLRIFTSRAAR